MKVIKRIAIALLTVLIMSCAVSKSNDIRLVNTQTNEEKPMNKIKTSVNRETNFIYHMVSVAKVGYDNDYGNRYAHLHSPEDLAILKRNELLLTVKGGEHMGELYGMFIGWPAYLDIEAKRYYESMYVLFKYGIDAHFSKFSDLWGGDNEQIREAISQFYNSHAHLTSNIIEICRVMIDNYDIFITIVWEESLKELLPFAEMVQNYFDTSDFTHRIETLMNLSLDTNFIASFTNSMAGGAEAIDIRNHNISGIKYRSGELKNIRDISGWLKHEYVIYLLRDVIPIKMEYWNYFESLAEFYLRKIEDAGMSTEYWETIVDFYNVQYLKDPSLTPLELFNLALKEFVYK